MRIRGGIGQPDGESRTRIGSGLVEPPGPTDWRRLQARWVVLLVLGVFATLRLAHSPRGWLPAVELATPRRAEMTKSKGV